MERRLFYSILLISLSVTLFAIYESGIFRLTGFFVGFGEPASSFHWWNVSWHYRFKMEINSTQYSRSDWIIEQRVNFTDIFPSGTFDENSTRVFEYDSSGSIIYEVPSQFDKDIGYNSASNAVGTLVFLMNGTTASNTKRYYFVYYDTIENGVKIPNVYDSDLVYDNSSLSSSGEFSVNNTFYNLIFDTDRGEYTSGLSYAEASPKLYIGDLDESDKTFEYLQYSNGTDNLMFDLRNKANFISTGPIRIVVEQVGNESLWNDPSSTTGKGMIVKRYIFYKNNSWIKVIQNFTNIDSSSLTRSSTEAGALAFDVSRAWSTGYRFGIGTDQENQTNPSDWTWGWASSAPVSNGMIGMINVNQTGTTNFWLTNGSSSGRIGIQLNSTSIVAGASITQTSIFYFNGSWYPNVIENLKDRLANPPIVVQSLPERWYVITAPSTNATIYNRNETVLIKGNVSVGDPYNITKYMNATLDMGTSSPADDQTIVLYDDGTHGDATAGDKIFTDSFGIPNDAELGIWTINFTTYTNNSEFLNSTNYTFNITDVLSLSANVNNKKPMVGSTVTANVYVKNYRQDSLISGAVINCSYGSSTVTNKTDYNNGTYSVNFTTPALEGLYNLDCNATKNGNFGSGTDNFTTEPAKTYISITAQPNFTKVYNMSLIDNGTFSFVSNISNYGNGTAYFVNISLELLNGWSANVTLQECGELDKNNYCTKGFNITVPNGTSPGNYSVNVTAEWKNPDSSLSSNKTQVNVSIEPNPKIMVQETTVSGETGDGISTIVGNFTVLSIGNDALQNVNFNCYSGAACSNFLIGFTPGSISNLTIGSAQSVSINVTVPLGYSPGTYTGIVNVSTQNDGFDTFNLNVTIPARTNVSTVSSISNYTARNITQKDSESFSFGSDLTNTKNGSARAVNMSLSIPSGWNSNSSLENCGNLLKGDNCSRGFNVTIAIGTSPGNYLVNLSSNWINPDNSMGTNKTSIVVTVASNPIINISESNVSGSIPDGTEKGLGNFTVLSIGNDALQNVNFNCYSGTVCQNFTVEFIPSSLSSLAVNSNQVIAINVTVPVRYPVGTYNGIVNVSATNDKYKNLTIEVTVPANRTWDMHPTYCEKSETPAEGLACEVNVTNYGNTYINFTVSPSQGNYTKPNETSFSTEYKNSHVFSINYNITGVPVGVFNSTFLVSAADDANPDNRTLLVSLLPFTEPIINISIVPIEIEQLDYVEFFVNVTDRSGTNITWTKINITRPDGILDNFNMGKIAENGNLTTWYLQYPSTSGNTSLRGVYNVTVYTKDNVGNPSQKNTTFMVYAKMSVALSALSDKYYQGDTGSIFYSVKDSNNIGVSGVNVTFTIQGPSQNVTYQNKYVSNQDGVINPLPSFSLPSDSPLGTYTLISNSTYYDVNVNKMAETIKNSSFQVLSRTVTVTGLFVDVETAVVWYPPVAGSPTPQIKFGILVYNGEGKPVDPDYINLTLYRPDGFIYFSDLMSNMQRQSTGYYTYQRNMLADTPTGMYLAVINATQGQFQTTKLKAFRVASGGPYDLWIDLFENEVQQGSYLDFSATMVNKGEVSQDVYLEWWITDYNGTKYYQESGWVLTPSLSNETVTKQAFIYQDQHLGTYFLNVKMSYDATQPPLVANKTFDVITKLVLPNITIPQPSPITVYATYAPPLPQPVANATEQLAADISITNYRSNISLAKGLTSIESVIVKNTGQANLNNVTLFLFGIPPTWFNVTPDNYRILPSGNSSVFLINFNVPTNAVAGEYKVNIIAESGVVSDQKYTTVTVFQTIKELLENDINSTKNDLKLLEDDVAIAKAEGKDVTTLNLYIDEIRIQISAAEDNLRNNKTEEALANVANAKNLLDRARNELNMLEIPKVQAVGFPFWLILLIVVIIAIIVLVIVILILRKKKMIPSLRPYIIPIGKEVEKVKKEELKPDFTKDREKLLRMLDVLEKEKSEGIISLVAYKEMKKSIEEKLEKIEKKLK